MNVLRQLVNFELPLKFNEEAISSFSSFSSQKGENDDQIVQFFAKVDSKDLSCSSLKKSSENLLRISNVRFDPCLLHFSINNSLDDTFIKFHFHTSNDPF